MAGATLIPGEIEISGVSFSPLQAEFVLKSEIRTADGEVAAGT
jgi:hypothetical protein